MEDGKVFIKRSIDFKLGEDGDGVFLEHRNMIDEVIRQYYKKVDEAYIQNMPDHILYSIEIQIHKEIERRNNAK